MAERILSIEDEATVRRSIVGYLEDSGFDMLEAENGRLGLECFRSEKPDLVLCDLRMPEVDGLTVLAEIASEEPETPIIIVSGTGDMGDAIEALKLGAWDYITKPIQDMAVLEHAVHKALERGRLIRENREKSEHLERTNERLKESLRRLEEDETAARHIQFQLLPEACCHIGEYECSRYLKTSAYLSGDFVDYFRIDDEHLGLYIADVSGHGVSSAFVTVLLKTTMNHLLEQYRQSESTAILRPEEVLSLLNVDLLNRDYGKYLTMFYMVVCERRGEMHYCNAGQFPFPLLYDGKKAQFLEDRNLPVGLFDDAAYTPTTLSIPHKLAFALFSDGVLEILPHKSLQEKQDFLLSLLDGRTFSMDSLVQKLGLGEIEGPLDDVTLILIKKGLK